MTDRRGLGDVANWIYAYHGAFCFPPFRDVVKNLAARCQDGVILGVSLPATNDAVDVYRIKLDEIAPPAGLVGGDQRRSAAPERIKDDAIATGDILDRVGD